MLHAPVAESQHERKPAVGVASAQTASTSNPVAEFQAVLGNRSVLRLANILQRKPAHTTPAPKPRFSDCTPTITGLAVAQKDVDARIQRSLRMARSAVAEAATAVRRIQRGWADASEQAVLKAHFGAPAAAQLTSILTRLTSIEAILATPDIRCRPAGHTECLGEDKKPVCARAHPAGKKSYMVLCPSSFLPQCTTEHGTLVHEAAHIAGASGNTRPPLGKPAPDALNNAFSFELFAVDIRTARLGAPSAPFPEERERPKFRSLIDDIVESHQERIRSRILESAP